MTCERHARRASGASVAALWRDRDHGDVLGLTCANNRFKEIRFMHGRLRFWTITALALTATLPSVAQADR